MATPNIVNVATINGFTTTATAGVTTAVLLNCPTDKIYKINSVICTNISSSNQAVYLSYDDTTASTEKYLAFNNTVPTNGSLVVIGKDFPIYLEETDNLKLFASANNSIDVTVSFESLED
tara:strand:+ start:106 stop:465 length:360 start_codon:yes stop_codon:yes gene_type:complete